MKKLIIYIIIIFTSLTGLSQNVFNKIIEDTIGHITNSVIALDTGYVFLSGTGNEYNIRSFALTYINETGEKQWKRVYGDSVLQYWEGWSGNLKKSNDFYYIGSGIVNTITGKYGIHISKFDDFFNLETQNILFYDSIDKRAFYTIKTENNDYFITGQICDYEDNETYKLLLLKANSSGEYLWHNYYNINISEYGSRIIETSDNNLVIGGRTEVTHINNSRWYLLKTDTAGNIIWERTFGRNNYNNGHVQAIIETADSNYIACGAYPAARFGGGLGEYLWDGCLRKIDKNGDLVWERFYRNYSKYSIDVGQSIILKDFFRSIYIDSDNYIYVLSNTYDYNPFSRGSLIKLTPEGDIIFKRLYYAIDQYSNEQWLVSMQPTNDGGFILAGYGNAYDWYGYNPPQQAWLVKTDSLGMDGLSNIEPDALNIDIDLPATVNCNDTLNVYVYISGKSAPYTIEFSTGQVIDSIFYPPVFVPTEIGLGPVNLYWGTTNYFNDTIREATISNHEWGQCIVKSIDFIAPTVNGEHTIYITVTDVYGESKTITKDITVYNCSENFVQEQEKQNINIYPNPAQNILYIDYPAIKEQTVINIFDAQGKKILSQTINKEKSEIDIRNLPSGSYVVEVSGEVRGFSVVK